VRAQKGAVGGVTFHDRARSLSVDISPGAINSVLRRRQLDPRRNERGGQLFGEITANRIFVFEATGARRGDVATPTSLVINRKAAQREINRRYARGTHFLGDWHTHPVHAPYPSRRDVRSMRELYRTSRHDVGALMMLIVGTSNDPSHWHCSLHNGDQSVILLPAN
jgi:integrative and conjugative element protein (TIGR02256 family)